ncbi:outer membrane beta-barrel protein [uncultured Aquimarina sp.]|uniref:outer membrane beta-barrel protein n=1 Tax=uncultured Aquimarina sp. TaxID=575652 RepID=UPI00262F1571|nr:outer membrane beta-barrel protein [uncultured Aquimarina sp.]
MIEYVKYGYHYLWSYFKSQLCAEVDAYPVLDKDVKPKNTVFVNAQAILGSKLLAFILFSLLSNAITSQSKEIINPKGKWFFGAEIGSNTITSYSLGESSTSLQGGILVEYYFAKHWSLSGRLKYFKTGVSFNQDATGGSGFFSFSSPRYSGVFNGDVFTIPINLKWEFRIYKNLSGNIKLGYAYNIETKSEYVNYTSNLRTDYPKYYGSVNPGVGLNYFVNKKMSVYIDFENYFGPKRGKTPGLFSDGSKYLNNLLFNVGVKYTFKNKE